MWLAQRPQHSEAGEAQTRGPSVSSQALYHWATAVPWKVEPEASLNTFTEPRHVISNNVAFLQV